MTTFLFPSSSLRPRQVDEHYAPEAEAARTLGAEVALLDHDVASSLAPGEPLPASALRRLEADTVVYRGWMLTPSTYTALSFALRKVGARLRTGAYHYQRAHQLPGWYAVLQEFTPESRWRGAADPAGLDDLLAEQGAGAAVLRDYSKSAKSAWVTACYVPDVTDRATAHQVASALMELRGKDFDSGLVLRRFENFTGPELRTWWVGGRLTCTSAHPDTPGEQPEVPSDFLTALAPAIESLDLPFVTVDITATREGSHRVVELGDGQVSDRPSSLDPVCLLRPLL